MQRLTGVFGPLIFCTANPTTNPAQNPPSQHHQQQVQQKTQQMQGAKSMIADGLVFNLE
jgi:hypothetical protein